MWNRGNLINIYQIYECIIIYESIDDDYVDELLWCIELLREVCLPFYKLRGCRILSPSLTPKSVRIWKRP